MLFFQVNAYRKTNNLNVKLLQEKDNLFEQLMRVICYLENLLYLPVSVIFKLGKLVLV